MPKTEKFTVNGNQVVEKVKQLIHEGNIRKVRIIHEGRTILEIPLSIGTPATAVVILAAPLLAALGAFAALRQDSANDTVSERKQYDQH